MTPFYFGASDQRLYGVYEAAHNRNARDQAVVLCNPVGNEHIHAHRTMRSLSTQLSKAGIHVLRFDYFGTGDSSGEVCEGDPQRWCDDIRSAALELREMTGAARMSLVGLRFGANLAARVAADLPNVVSLVLWDPLHASNDAVDDSAVHDPRSLATFLAAASVVSLPARTLVLVTAKEGNPAAWEGAHIRYLPSPSPWLDGFLEPKIIPVDAVSVIVKWLQA
jgi:alpha/beta superfamily hydrolase